MCVYVDPLPQHLHGDTPMGDNLNTLPLIPTGRLKEMRDRIDEIIRYQDNLIAQGVLEEQLHKSTVVNRPYLVRFRSQIDDELHIRGA